MYGWSIWKRAGMGKSGLPVSVWPLATHATAISVIVLLAGGCGYLLSRYSDAAFPYVDSLTTFAAIWTTFLVARKVQILAIFYLVLVIRQNIWFSLGVKLIFVVLAFSGFASLWAAIAADMGASLLVIFNSLRLLQGNR